MNLVLYAKRYSQKIEAAPTVAMKKVQIHKPNNLMSGLCSALFVVSIYKCTQTDIARFVYMHKSDKFVTFSLTSQSKSDIIVT